MTSNKNIKIAVLITTDNTKRGVFMGLVNPADMENENIMAEEVRMVVRWTQEVKGVIGLAVNGPSKSCRITAAAPKALIKGVSAVFELTDKALANFRKEPWGN